MARDITAIPTVYNGVQLKSRMESKVALLLDKLGWKWEYEPFSVMLDGINYTPDFYIPEQGYVIECRGYDSDKGQQQIERFAKASPRLQLPGRVVNLYGVIGPEEAQIWDSTEEYWRSMVVLICGECGGWAFHEDGCGGGEDTAVDCEPIEVSRGQILFGLHAAPPEDWDRLGWTLDDRDRLCVEKTKIAALGILRSIGIGIAVAEKLEQCPVVPTRGHTKNRTRFRYAILLGPEVSRGFNERAISAAITLTGKNPNDVLVEERLTEDG